MPILAKEPACFPDNLFQEMSPGTGEHWWVFYTRPRSEKAIARFLRAHRIPYFLPLYKRYSRVQGRTLMSWNPLFPNYIFVFGGAEAKLAALKTNYVVTRVEVPDQQQLHHDLVQIYTVAQSELPYYPEKVLRPGTPVAITAGPLMGLSGQVLTWISPLRLIIEVRLLQRAVCVEIEPWMVAKN